MAKRTRMMLHLQRRPKKLKTRKGRKLTRKSQRKRIRKIKMGRMKSRQMEESQRKRRKKRRRSLRKLRRLLITAWVNRRTNLALVTLHTTKEIEFCRSERRKSFSTAKSSLLSS